MLMSIPLLEHSEDLVEILHQWQKTELNRNAGAGPGLDLMYGLLSDPGKFRFDALPDPRLKRGRAGKSVGLPLKGKTWRGMSAESVSD